MQSHDELKLSLGEVPTYALEQMAAAHRELLAELGRRLEQGGPVAPMYSGTTRLAQLELVARVVEELLAERRAAP